MSHFGRIKCFFLSKLHSSFSTFSQLFNDPSIKLFPNYDTDTCDELNHILAPVPAPVLIPAKSNSIVNNVSVMPRPEGQTRGNCCVPFSGPDFLEHLSKIGKTY